MYLYITLLFTGEWTGIEVQRVEDAEAGGYTEASNTAWRGTSRSQVRGAVGVATLGRNSVQRGLIWEEKVMRVIVA